MKICPPSLFQFIGVLTNGDLGPYTFYTSHRKRLVVFLKTWPKDPASYNQKLNRDRWRHAALRWHAIGPTVRADWARLAREANLTITGYNLFMHYITNANRNTVLTCQRLTGINVLDATGDPLPYLKA